MNTIIIKHLENICGGTVLDFLLFFFSIYISRLLLAAEKGNPLWDAVARPHLYFCYKKRTENYVDFRVSSMVYGNLSEKAQVFHEPQGIWAGTLCHYWPA